MINIRRRTVTRARQGNGILRTAFLSILAAFSCITLTLSLDTAARDSTSFSARDILHRTGVQGELIVYLNCGDGKLTAALRANDSTIVQGLDQNPENVAKARKHIRPLGLYGPVSAEQWNGKSIAIHQQSGQSRGL
jgi:predicted RNA methylase